MKLHLIVKRRKERIGVISKRRLLKVYFHKIIHKMVFSFIADRVKAREEDEHDKRHHQTKRKGVKSGPPPKRRR